MKTRLFSLVLGGLFLTQSVIAQDGANQITYSTLAQQFVQNNQNGDAHSTILPSVAIANGFGSFIDNPASVALITDTYFSIGYLSNHAENTNTFKNVSSTIDRQLGRFSNIGLIYSAPTDQGVSFLVVDILLTIQLIVIIYLPHRIPQARLQMYLNKAVALIMILHSKRTPSIMLMFSKLS